MEVSVITGLISAAAAIVVCLVNNHYQKAEADRKHTENINLIAYRLEQLEKKVDLHNNMIERTYNLEKRQEVTEEQIKVANHRIDDLERGA